MKYSSLLFASALLLSACGFTPVHDPGLAAGSSAMKNIDVYVIEPASLENQEGAYWLRQSLVDRIGDNNDGNHVLELRPTFRRTGAGITADDVATRLTLRANVPYKLIDRKTGDVLETGSVSYSSVYGATREPYGQESASEVTLRNVSREAADRLVIELASYYAKADK